MEPMDEVRQKRLKAKQMEFVIEPYIRFEGQVGETATLFFLDPENNALEFKAFKNMDQKTFLQRCKLTEVLGN